MGVFSKFEGKMEDTLEGGASKMSNSPISPVQIIKKAERQMRRERMVSAGKEYAPTLYTVLVNPDDDERLFGFYPTLAGEAETALAASATNEGLVMDGHPLVRFIVDDTLRHGKFDVVAEVVSAPIVEQLREEENAHYGIGSRPAAQPRAAQRPQPAPQELPYVPEDEIDRSIDYGEYTFNSEDFVHAQDRAASGAPQAAGAGAGGNARAAIPTPPAVPAGAAGAPAGEPDVVVVGSRGAEQPQAAAQSMPGAGYPASAGRQMGIPSIYDSEEADDEALRAVSQPFGNRAAGQPSAGQQPGTPSGNFSNNAAAQAAYASAGQVFDGNATPQQARQAANQQVGGQQLQPGFVNPQAYAVQPHGAQPYAAAQQARQQASSAEAYPREPQSNDFGQPVSDVFGNRPARNQVPYVVPTVMDVPSPASPSAPGAPGTPGTVTFAGGPQGRGVPQRTAVRARLTNTMTNRAYDLATTRALIGRETNNDIVVNDLNASRQHAEIHYEPQGVWVITDLGSTNGTLVNGQMVQRRGLQEGDRITIGITDFIFSLR